MAPGTHYSNYYDPVGSNANQPQEYTYQPSSASPAPFLGPATSTFSHNTYTNYGTSYEQQQQPYGAASQQQVLPSGSANRAAAAILSNLGNLAFSQPSPVNRPSSAINQYSDSDQIAAASQMQSSFVQSANNHPIHKTSTMPSDNTVSHLGKFVAHPVSQTNIDNYGDNQQSRRNTPIGGSLQAYPKVQSTSMSSEPGYQTSYAQQGSQPSLRYNSPVHVMPPHQTQQGHNLQSSRATSHRQSPQIAGRGLDHIDKHQRQQSMSVEPSPTTVDPSQVYDFRAEQQRKAQMEAQKQRKLEAEQAAWQKQEAARQVARARAEMEKRRVEEESRQAQEAEASHKAAEETARREAAEELKREKRRNARKEKRQRTPAASTLHQIASSSGNERRPNGNTDAGGPLDDEEVQMRAMFKRMREFNQKNPAMLAKLWEEERQAHLASPRPQSVPPSQPPPSAPLSQSVNQSPPKSRMNEVSSSKPGRPELPLQQRAQRANTPAAASAAAPALASALERDNPPISGLDQKKSKSPISSLPDIDPKITRQTADGPPQQTSTTLWPPHKKGILADAAAKWLSNLASTRATGRTVSREEILRVLDSNPSYAQLCEAIERLGIRFERSLLARELLKVVPGGLKTQPLPKEPVAVGPIESRVPQSGPLIAPGTFTTRQSPAGRGEDLVSLLVPDVAYGITTSAAQHAIDYNANKNNGMSPAPTGATRDVLPGPSSTLQQIPPPSTGLTIVNKNQPLPHLSQVKAEAVAVPQEPPKPPADKEEAARKRTFSDLVDLTEGDSDDEMPPLKMIKFQPAGGTGFIPPQGNFQPPMPSKPYQPNAHLQGYQAQPSPLGAGHQTGNGPLTTIPGPAPLQKPKGPGPEHQQKERIRGKMLVEPLMRDRVARKSQYDVRTIARDVLLATGRHPDMRALNAHLNPMDKLLSTHGGAADGIGNKSDLSTIRWDIIDPGLPSKTEGATGPRPGDETGVQQVNDNGETPKQYRPSSLEITRPGQTPQGTPDWEGNSADRKRRGRPPGSQSASSKGESALAVPFGSISLGGSPARHQNTPERGVLTAQGNMSLPNLPKNASSSVGYAALRPVDEFGNVIKKKGRPVGWRKNIHSREANGLAPASAPKSSDSRPRTGAPGHKKKELQSPHYEVYHCQWRDCAAELHNLDTLKKHIVKLHGRAGDHGKLECAWRGCSAAVNRVESPEHQRNDDNSLLAFSDADAWLDHITKQHLQAIAWRLGDGPRGGNLSDHAAAQSNAEAPYLSDAHGRSVTPVIVPGRPDADEHFSTSWASPHMLKDGMSKSERQAAAALKELEDAKRAEGPYMGAEGTILANPKRRLGFLDDEDFADEVDSSEIGEE